MAKGESESRFPSSQSALWELFVGQYSPAVAHRGGESSYGGTWGGGAALPSR